MTCIEKLRELYPDWDDEKVRYYVERWCPSKEYILHKPFECNPHGWEDTNYDCKECWNREVYEDEDHNRHDIGLFLNGEDIRRLDSITERTGYSRDKVVQAALRLLEGELDTYGESVVVEDWSMEVKVDG